MIKRATGAIDHGDGQPFLRCLDSRHRVLPQGKDGEIVPLLARHGSFKDDAIQLSPAIKFTLEQALDFIDDDELAEVTPKEIRLRKKHLTENDRKKASRSAS